MEAVAVAKQVRMSPRKVRLVVDQIRGLSVNEAVSLLEFSKKAASVPVGKTLQSAVANATDRADRDGDDVDVDDLVVSRVFVDEGPTYKQGGGPPPRDAPCPADAEPATSRWL